MIKKFTYLLTLIVISGCLIFLGNNGPETEITYSQENGLFSVLLFTKTAGFRHASIGDGIATIEALAAANQFQVDHSEDAAVFNDATLANYQVVVFLNTTGDILNNDQQAAFERFIQNGGGFVGVHSATDTEYDWAWYGGLVGAYFNGHPAIQQATVQIEDGNHLSTYFLNASWIRTDEWYNFRDGPGAGLNILLTVDESTYTGGMMGAYHPIAWYHQYDGGRSWYTAMGHTSASYSEPDFQSHLLGGILWAADIEALLPEKTYLPIVIN